jgi:DNA-binding GntR family transcriptional regulator
MTPIASLSKSETRPASPSAPKARDSAVDAPTNAPKGAHKSSSAVKSSASPPSADDIYERVYTAILEHRLKPGTKLGEDRMAAIFHVNRSRIREVFARLCHDGVVEQVAQRGAFVAKPTPEAAHEVFEMRRLVEPGVVSRLIGTQTPEKLQALRAHYQLEVEARSRGDKRAVIRLSGEFHTLLAELAGNAVMAKSMRILATLTCLVIALYDAPTTDACRADEHHQIIDAISKRDRVRAEKLMLGHLSHIEESFNFDAGSEHADLEAIFLGT